MSRSSEPPTNPTPTRPRRPWRRLFRLLLGAAVVLVVAFLTRAGWVPPLVRSAAPALLARLGAELSVDDVRGDGTGHLELRGLRLVANGGLGPLRRVLARELTIDFSLPTLLRRGMPGIGRLEGRGVEVELDFRATADDTDETEETDAPPEEGDAEPPWLPLPPLDLEDCRLLLTFDGEHEVEATGLDVTILSTERPGSVTASSLVYRAPDIEPIEHRVALTASLDRGGVDIATLAIGEDVEGERVRLAWADDEDTFAWRGSLALHDGNAELSGSWGKDGLRTGFDVRDVDLGELDALWPGGLGCEGGRVRQLSGRIDVTFAPALAVDGDVAVGIEGLDFGESAFDIDGEVRFADGRVLADAITVAQPGNRFLLTEVSVPLVEAGASDVLRDGRAAVALDVRDLPQLLGRTRGAKLAGRVPEHHLVLSATLADGSATVAAGRLDTPGGAVEIRGGTVDARGDDPVRVDLDLFADFDDLAPLGVILGTSPWGGTLEGGIQVSGFWPELTGAAQVTGANVLVVGVALGQVEADLFADSAGLRITRLDATDDGAELALSGAFDFASRELQGVRFRIEVAKLERLLTESPVSGSVHVVGEAAGAIGELAGSWSLDAADVVIGAQRIERLVANGALDGALVRIASLELLAEGLALTAGAELELDDALAPVAANLSALSLVRDGATLSLVAPVRVLFGGSVPTLEPGQRMKLEGGAGSLSVWAWSEPVGAPPAPNGATPASPSDPVLAFGLDAKDFSPTALMAPFVPEGLALTGFTGTLVGRRTESMLALASKGEVRQLDLPLADVAEAVLAEPWAVSWDMTLASDVLDLRTLEARAGTLSSVVLTGTVPLDLFGVRESSTRPFAPGPLALRGRVDVPEVGAFAVLVPAESPWPTGRLACDLDLSGEWNAIEGTLELDAVNLDLAVAGTPMFEGASISGSAVLGETTALRGLRISVPGAARMAFDGTLHHPLDLTRLARREPLFPYATELALSAGLIVEDATWIERLNRALGSELLRRVGGRFAATLDVGGTVGEPFPRGQLELDGGQLKFSPVTPSIERLSGLVEVEGRRFELVQFTGELGAAPFSVHGVVDLDADPPALDLELTGENLLLYRAQGVKARADAALQVTGDPSRPHVSGTVRLRDSRFVKRFDFLSLGRGGGGGPAGGAGRAIELFSFRDPPLSRATFDVRVGSAEPFRIDNNVLEARLRPDLRLSGTGETPELVGVIYVDGGKVTLPANDLYLRPGTITLDREEPMIPQLGLLLENRVRGYDVTVTVGGPYDDPEIVFSSSPPLRAEELTALVLAGQDPSEGGLSSKTGVAGAQAVGAFLAQDLITRLFGDESTESGESIGERIELFLGRDTTQDGGETIEVTYRMKDDVFGEDSTLYLTTEEDEYAHYNFGLRLVFRFE